MYNLDWLKKEHSDNLLINNVSYCKIEFKREV